MTQHLTELQRWYAAQCNGEWEHAHGIQISTLDNPGWRLSINLEGTNLEAHAFEEIQENLELETGWLRCRRTKTHFEAACHPLRLDDAVKIFLDWITL